MTRRNGPLVAAALIFCAQLLLAWHAPSHLQSTDNGPLTLVSATDCEICLPGQGAAPAPQLAQDQQPPVPDPIQASPRQSLFQHTTVPGAGPRAPPVLS